MLTVSGAAVAFERVKALDEIDLEVATGEVVAILGALFAGRRGRDARWALRGPARWPEPRGAAQASTCLGIRLRDGRRL